MEIKRDFYLQKLIDRNNNHLIKIVTGIRRCGKSYLLNHLFKNYLLDSGVDDSHIIMIALDDDENSDLLDSKKLRHYIVNCMRVETLQYKSRKNVLMNINIQFIQMVPRIWDYYIILRNIKLIKKL